MARPVPADLEDALAAAPAAREHFWALPPEQVDEWVAWVERPRMRRARRRRIAEAVRRLGGGRPVAATTAVETNGGGPVAAPPRDSLWLWLLALALLIGIGALSYWFAVRNDHGGAKPASVVIRVQATVPKLVGLRQQAAQFQLREEKLAVTVVKRPAAKPRGIVVGQKPKAGASVPQGTPVTLVVSSGPPGVKLPSVVGLAAADAAKRLQDLKLTPTLKQVPSTEAPGTVIAQKPPAGARAKPGTPVVLEVSKSKTSVPVPDVTGRTQQDATAALRQAGLNVSIAQVPSSQPKGTVVAQSPAAGQKVAQGHSVRLNVSNGATQQTTTQQATTQQATTQQAATQTTTQRTTTQQSGTSSSLPSPPPQGSGNDYRGMQLARAVEKIAQGRQQAIVLYVASTKPAGIVVSNGTVGSKLRLAVSAGPKPGPATARPDVTGEDAAQAQSDLESAGFSVLTVQWPVSDQSANGTVVSQTPAGGGTAPRGVTIVLYIGSYSGG
jgi:beta-lactam-binding protein with PASTA domain